VAAGIAEKKSSDHDVAVVLLRYCRPIQLD
jgi:hypothetical protein